LRVGNYVPAYCKQGGLVLQSSPGCANLANIHEPRNPKKTTCFTAQTCQ
jgi:hypothetical protein